MLHVYESSELIHGPYTWICDQYVFLDETIFSEVKKWMHTNSHVISSNLYHIERSLSYLRMYIDFEIHTIILTIVLLF